MSLRELEARWAFWRIFHDASVANRLARVAAEYWAGGRAG